MQSTAIPPVRKSIEVATAPANAFRIFTSDMHRWWPNCGHDHGREAIVLEPRAGGRWFERVKGGAEHPWGHVLEWAPPDRVVLAWQRNMESKFDPSLVTEVEIRFQPAASGRTLVSVEHRKLERYGARAEEAVKLYEGPNAWVGVLEALRAASQTL